MLAGLSAEIFVDKPARVSRFMDNLQTCHVSGRILKDSSAKVVERDKRRQGNLFKFCILLFVMQSVDNNDNNVWETMGGD